VLHATQVEQLGANATIQQGELLLVLLLTLLALLLAFPSWVMFWLLYGADTHTKTIFLKAC
jgi:hypothetical protein